MKKPAEINQLNRAIETAKMIEARAQNIAIEVAREIDLACGGRPEFTAIMLHAVEIKIMALRHAAQRLAAGVKS